MTREIYIHSNAPAAIAALVAVGTRASTAKLVVEYFLEGDYNAPTAAQAAIIRPLLVRLETEREAAEREAASAAHDAARAVIRAQEAAEAEAKAAVRAQEAAVDNARGGVGNVGDIYRLAPHLCNVTYSSASLPGDDRTDDEGNQVWKAATPNIRAADDKYAREVWARVARGGRVMDVVAEMGPDPAREAVKAEREAEKAEQALEDRIYALRNAGTLDAAAELEAIAADPTVVHWLATRAREWAADIRKNVAYREAHMAEVARMEAVYAARREAKAARRGGHYAPVVDAAPAPPAVKLNDPWAALGGLSL